ncbi:MAG: hypothetical protein NT004_10835 [Bacteroidetes bacterium]|nr:hypothetical protein [Bacteroidota bacterium]
MNKLNIRIRFFLSALCFFALSQVAIASDPLEPPPPPGGHGSNGNQNPLGAPIDGGLTIFLAFAAAYSGREWYKGKREKLNEVE